MRRWLLVFSLLLQGCGDDPAESEPPPARQSDPWSNAAEQTFQDAEALKYELEQWSLEQQSLQQLEVEGAAPLRQP